MQPTRWTTGSEQLRAVAGDTDYLGIDSEGTLLIDGISATDIVAQHGSPVYVVVEKTLRANFRNCKAAFVKAWPGRVEVLYAIKANNNLAIRAIISSEGGGGDCYGMGELRATFETGTNPEIVVMNGSLKFYDEIREAIARGAAINLDAEDEIEKIERACAETGKRARVNIRLKMIDEAFAQVGSDYGGVSEQTGLNDKLIASKWGFSQEKAALLTKRLQGIHSIDHVGFSYHLGRFSARRDDVRLVYKNLGEILRRLCDETGFWPKVIDIGGGMPRRRDPESRTPHLQDLGINEYAQIACGELLKALSVDGRSVPDLWLEPGRYIVGNASLLLATVGTVKCDLGRRWVNVDASTNLLMRIDTNGSQHTVLPATGMERFRQTPANIVGLTCVSSILASDLPSPEYRPGDLIALLDAGMYSEVVATQFNGIPRPATVLVGQGIAEVIKARETIDDVFRQHRIPSRLLSSSALVRHAS